jgi:hypothetical protein
LTGAETLLAELHDGGADVALSDDGRIEVRGTLTDDQRAAIRQMKSALVCALAAERRRATVRAMMARAPDSRRYFWFVDAEAEVEHVIVALAIRDVGTCELSIPRERYDGFKLIEILDGASGEPAQ